MPYRSIVNSDGNKTEDQVKDIPETKKDSLLLVEDNLINQRLTKLILEKAGFDVLTANNGQEAVNLYQSKNNIKLIIMDIQMPVLDGLSATQIIRYHDCLLYTSDAADE